MSVCSGSERQWCGDTGSQTTSVFVLERALTFYTATFACQLMMSTMSCDTLYHKRFWFLSCFFCFFFQQNSNNADSFLKIPFSIQYVLFLSELWFNLDRKTKISVVVTVDTLCPLFVFEVDSAKHFLFRVLVLIVLCGLFFEDSCGLLQNATQCFTDREAPIGFVPILALARSWRAHYSWKNRPFAVSLFLSSLQPSNRPFYHVLSHISLWALLYASFFSLSLTHLLHPFLCVLRVDHFCSLDRRGQRNKKEPIVVFSE